MNTCLFSNCDNCWTCSSQSIYVIWISALICTWRCVYEECANLGKLWWIVASTMICFKVAGRDNWVQMSYICKRSSSKEMPSSEYNLVGSLKKPTVVDCLSFMTSYPWGPPFTWRGYVTSTQSPNLRQALLQPDIGHDYSSTSLTDVLGFGC